MKSYTDLEQSKKLAKILPLESADMYYISGDECDICFGRGVYEDIADWICEGRPKPADIPCWSLAALLKYLSEIKPQVYTLVLFPSESKWKLHFVEYGNCNVCEVFCDNPVDACYEMILKLNELNLL